MKRLILYSLICAFALACSKQYSGIDPTPTLKVSPEQDTCPVGVPLEVRLISTQKGIDGDFAITIFLRQGSASISIDGSEADTSGTWIALQNPEDTKLVIVPQVLEDLVIEFRVRGPMGALSQEQTLSIAVTASTPLVAAASCEAQVVNLGVDDKVPVQLHIDGDAKTYDVKPSLELGSGKIYYDNNLVNNSSCPVSGDATFYFDPEIIGEHILTFEVTAGGTTTTARAYMDVIKDIVVKSPVDGCFTIKGSGSHNVEGEEVTLELVNDELFNFEVAGWYDAEGNLLSEEPTFNLTMNRDCMTDIEVKLKQREVNISRDGIRTFEFAYLIMQNGKPVWRTAYDYRTQCIGDYRVSEPIIFYYEEYILDKSTAPPPKKKRPAAPLMAKGVSRSTYLWRCDQKFTIYLRASDNPGFRFNFAQKYIESETTRYYISSQITMQN